MVCTFNLGSFSVYICANKLDLVNGVVCITVKEQI